MHNVTRRKWLRGLTVSALLGIAACGILGPDLIDDTGTIRFSSDEGGCWTIETTGETFLPLQLGDEFKVDGLGVRFTAERQESAARICPGAPVHLREIEAFGS